MGLWQRLTSWSRARAEHREEQAEQESPAERRFAAEGVDGLAADEAVQERLGGVDPDRLVDDEFKP
jgi:hypothetical protein